MATNVRGTFVIPWAQTRIDGVSAPPLGAMEAGADWTWTGEALRVDGPATVLELGMRDEDVALRRGAARMVSRLVGLARRVPELVPDLDADTEEEFGDLHFTVTDGRRSYVVTLIPVAPGKDPLLMFTGDMPPQRTDLWVVTHALHDAPDMALDAYAREHVGGVICFTPGTLIETPTGRRRVEDLREGDFVQTVDNGPQPIVWLGRRHMTGARLFSMPRLRPIRLRWGAFGHDTPDRDSLVSPDHRIVVNGAAARELFNTDEVLVRAGDLVNGGSVSIDLTVREVTYLHLMLPRHEILRADGIETESFHPGNVALSSLDPSDHLRLLDVCRDLDVDPSSYGAYVRRNLSRAEAVLLKHSAA
ncbi:Hint domain-containing protein [Pseudaestuariivita sp.]|uniref:Hint domain-containing protein n=1 Tax=Pseudaestuariivita sp. TaxID=2211669 RepID=UPI0040582BB2